MSHCQARQGTLRPPGSGPRTGEEFDLIASQQGVVIEHILSGDNAKPTGYLQRHDEWVVLLAGGAVLSVAGKRHELAPGDWIFLPAGVAHRVERTEAGTSWIAVHFPQEVPHEDPDKGS